MQTTYLGSAIDEHRVFGIATDTGEPVLAGLLRYEPNPPGLEVLGPRKLQISFDGGKSWILKDEFDSAVRKLSPTADTK
jgi:hypothetical protein